MRWAAVLWTWLRRRRPPPTLGQRGEQAAAKHLRRLGYRILARGDRSAPGELDLVALQGRTIVFVEVKTRHTAQLGHPSEAVDAQKQRRLTRLAVAWLKRHRLLEARDVSARFDVVAVTWPDGQRRPQIEHIVDAFPAVGRWEYFS